MKKTFKSMCKIAKDNPDLLTNYTDDLYKWDKLRLFGEDPPVSFGWVIRQSGTLLLDGRMNSKAMAAYIDALDPIYNLQKYFLCSKDGVKEMDLEPFTGKMIELARDSERDIKKVYSGY